MVPLQVMWSRTDQRRASGTSLAAILPIALIGAAVYYFGRGMPQIDLPVALFLALGSSAGAFAGAHVSRRIPANVLQILVAIMLVVVGLKEVYDAILGVSSSLRGSAGSSLDMQQYMVITLSGLVIGVLSGLTGIGGGILLVPTMVLGFGIAQRIAQGTSLLVILPTAAIGGWTHYRHGNVDVRSAVWIAVVGGPAALLGAALALWLPERILVGVFGLFLIFAATRIWPRHNRVALAQSGPGQSKEAKES